jgi:outer membrane protein insertion porin family
MTGFAADTVVGRVDFESVEVYSPSKLRSVVGWNDGTTLQDGTIETGLARLSDFYRQSGYLFVEASARTEPLGNGVRVVFTVREGKRARLSAFDVVGGDALANSAIRGLMRVRTDAPFDESSWQRAVDRVLDAYANRGYPFAKVTTVVGKTRPDEGVFTLRLLVDEGPLVRIERVEFEGLTKTRPAVARRLVPVRDGERFDRRRVEATRYRLLNSGYFAEVHPSLIQRGSAEDRVVLRARVGEARTGRIAGVVGYAPAVGVSDTPQLTGLIEAAETNLAGTGREIGFHWESGETRSTRFQYREPSLFGIPLSAGIAWNAERIESSRRQSGIVRVDWQNDSFWSVGVGAQFARADASAGRGFLLESVYDRRDYRSNPSSGWLLRVRADVVRGDLNVTRYDAAFEAYRRLWRRHVVGVRLNESRVRGTALPASELVYLGGASTLRGYREREFRGTSRLVGGLEYRIITGPDSRVFAFVDAGTVGDAVARLPTRLGFGVGANLESRGGILRLDYGLAPRTSPSKGKVHIRLGTMF